MLTTLSVLFTGFTRRAKNIELKQAVTGRLDSCLQSAIRHSCLQIHHRRIKKETLKMVFKALHSSVLAVVFFVARGGGHGPAR